MRHFVKSLTLPIVLTHFYLFKVVVLRDHSSTWKFPCIFLTLKDLPVSHAFQYLYSHCTAPALSSFFFPSFCSCFLRLLSFFPSLHFAFHLSFTFSSVSCHYVPAVTIMRSLWQVTPITNLPWRSALLSGHRVQRPLQYSSCRLEPRCYSCGRWY